jgi:hypothetical protein
MWWDDTYVALIEGQTVPVLDMETDDHGRTRVMLQGGATACPPCAAAGFDATPWMATRATMFDTYDSVQCDSCRSTYPMVRTQDVETCRCGRAFMQGSTPTEGVCEPCTIKPPGLSAGDRRALFRNGKMPQ